MDKFIVVGVFTIIVLAFVIGYERPSTDRKKLTGRGGDFES
jgi:hypothetical protein